MKKLLPNQPASMRDFERRAAEILAKLQEVLLPEHASEFIGINVDTGEYVLASPDEEVWKKFRARWPHSLGYFARVDGGPVVKFHGFVP